MSVDLNNFQSYSLLVNKMLEKVKGSDLEPIWNRLAILMSKLNSLNNPQRGTLEATLRNLVEKIEHFQKISNQKLETQASNFAAVNNDLNAPEINLTKKRNIKNFRFKRSPYITAMSPRRDSVIPRMKIKLSEIKQFKKQKEERRKKKKAKMAMEKEKIDEIKDNINQQKPEATQSANLTEKINVSNNESRNTEISNDDNAVNNKVSTPISPYDLKDCSVRLDIHNQFKKTEEPQTIHIVDDSDDETIPISLTKNGSKADIEPSINPIEQKNKDKDSTNKHLETVLIHNQSDRTLRSKKSPAQPIKSPKKINKKNETKKDTLKSLFTRRQTRNSIDCIRKFELSVKSKTISKNETTSSVQNILTNLRNKISVDPVKIKPTARKSTKSSTATKSLQLNKNSTSVNKTQSSLKENEKTSVIKPEPPPLGYMTPPMTEIPLQLILKNAERDKKLILLSDEFTLKKLRPWIQKSSHRKYFKKCDDMISNGFCLSALFKCMGSTCSYFTNNPTLFIQHLQRHQKFQPDDLKNFSTCSYCDVNIEDMKELIEHIKRAHGYNRYQCTYCFYRSYDFHIHTHHRLYHALKSEAVIECTPLNTINMKIELSKVWSNFFNVCRSITCCVCKGRFYNIKLFKKHFESHKVVPQSRCLKCVTNMTQETIIDHLKSCHGFGDFNCAFCLYGSDSLDSIEIHLSNHHFDRPLLYFDRSIELKDFDAQINVATSNEDISKMLVLKQKVQKKPNSMKIIKIFNSNQEHENVNNINSELLDIHVP